MTNPKDRSANGAAEMQSAVCSVPLPHTRRIVLGHGSGGKLMMDLIRNTFLPPLGNPVLRAGDDAGVVAGPPAGWTVAISTDSHVVSPLFFPGGDIGRLAVCGTVNDLSMRGAEPKYLSAGFILEEGLDVALLERVIESMKAAAEEACVEIVAGDTKVVQSGKADGLYINTAGVGWVRPGREIAGANARPGDAVLVSGALGNHGIAVLAARGELGFDTRLESDCAPLNHLVEAILRVSGQVRVLRDPTRGGLATSVNEIASQSQVGILLQEDLIPVHPAVEAACEMLGFDPLYIANEGRLLAIVGQSDADAVLSAMRTDRYGEHASRIGEIVEAPKGRVLMRTAYGTTRVVDVLMGEMLPRIC